MNAIFLGLNAVKANVLICFSISPKLPAPEIIINSLVSIIKSV